jgi:hypothetical protein
MTVNLSALAGAGQQFFDNNGVILSGGKLYSYTAGTSTPQATYTSISGATAHTNPIVLNSAGRVATGEIWLTAGSNYKFVLYTSANFLIATWDNITGINGTGIATNASNVQYDPAGVGAVATTVQAKLRQTISSTDYSSESYAVSAAVSQLPVNFWSNQTPPPNNRRIPDRVFIGEAVRTSGNESNGASESWVNNAFGAYWLERGSQLFTLPDSDGYIGEFSAVRTSTINQAGGVGIGMASLGWNDYVGNLFVWAGYFEVSREANAGVSYGLEIAGKNKGSNHIRSPYARDSNGILGIFFAGGGDPAYNGSSANPNNVGIVIGKNSNTWNTGICFDADALTGSDGVTGNAAAIKMGKGHQIEWWASATLQTAIIRSDGADLGAITKYLLFKNTKVSIEANSVTDLYSFDLGLTPANGLIFSAGVLSSNATTINAAGSDTNIDINLVPKGSGTVSFGFFTAGALSPTGYIFIKDSGGTSRRLLVG